MNRIREAAWKYAVFNASQYGGKANSGSVMGRIFAEFAEAKENPKEIQRIVAEAVAEVNSMPLKKQLEAVQRWPELFETKKVEEKKTLTPLKNLDRFPKVRVRFAPNPDGPLHLGSAESIIFSDEYAKMYNGEFILRYEDTSADVKPPIIEMYDWIKEDIEWLGVRIHEVYAQSDRMDNYYDHAVRLLEMGKAYVCTCDSEEFKELYMKKRACKCRATTPKDNVFKWKKMLEGSFKRGEAVVRIKTDIEHPNPAIRDWPALRISTRAHPRVGKKFRVWPLYNFSCAVDDHLMTISHVIRGKEHEANTTRQKYIFDYFGWQFPEVINVGRLGLEVGILSKSKIRAGVELGTFSGWDDPRLGTLRALRRRGLQPETIREIMIQIGPKPINATLSWANIAAVNKKIIDPRANRYFFVEAPMNLTVTDIPGILTAKLSLHPDYTDRGYREYSVKPIEGKAVFLLASKDLLAAEGKLIRLMGLANVEVTNIGESPHAKFHSKEHQVAREKNMPFIHWIYPSESVEATVVMPDASRILGKAESLCSGLSVNEMIQYERFGFVRVDAQNPMVCYYAHD